MAELQALADQPERWTTVDPEQLRMLTYLELNRYGITNDGDMVPKLMHLYGVLAQCSSMHERMDLLARITEAIDEGVVSNNALMPFIYVDPDFTVISTASLNLAVLMPLENENPMTGPRYLRHMAEDLTAPDEHQTNRLGILSGLVLLGDRRVTPYLDQCWTLLDVEHQVRLTQSRSNFVYAAVVEFYLDWLEACLVEGDEHIFGAVAAAVYRAADMARATGGVSDVERKFPANGPGDSPPVAILSEWTVEDFGRVIEPRLRSLNDREPEPRVMPTVMERWGIPRPPGVN